MCRDGMNEKEVVERLQGWMRGCGKVPGVYRRLADKSDWDRQPGRRRR